MAEMNNVKTEEIEEKTFFEKHGRTIIKAGLWLVIGHGIYSIGHRDGRIANGKDMDKLLEGGYIGLTRPKKDLVRMTDGKEWFKLANGYLKNR